MDNWTVVQYRSVATPQVGRASAESAAIATRMAARKIAAPNSIGNSMTMARSDALRYDPLPAPCPLDLGLADKNRQRPVIMKEAAVRHLFIFCIATLMTAALLPEDAAARSAARRPR